MGDPGRAAEFGEGSGWNVEGLEQEGGPCEDGLWDGGTGLVGGDLGGASSGCGASSSSLSLSGRARSTSLGGSNGRCSGTELSCVLRGFRVRRGKIYSSNMTSVVMKIL